MKEGKVNAALNLLTQHSSGGVLNLDDTVPCGDDQLTVCDILIKKHPPRVNPPADALLPGLPNPTHDVIFDSLDANLIQKAATRTTGAAGLSRLDAFAWRRLCTSYII